jgi:hypothetical protein
MVDSAALHTALIPPTEANRDRTDGVPKPSPNRPKGAGRLLFLQAYHGSDQRSYRTCVWASTKLPNELRGSIPVARSEPGADNRGRLG